MTMVFYEKETLIGLLLASIPAILSVYFFFILEKKKVALILLLASAFLLRLLMISLDPYLHEWDERFHALVAKNMITHPFKPMLFTHHIMKYDLYDWGYNHIWVHKQPLFLWQMALSMKWLGVNTFALRLPSALMGVLIVWLVYDIGRKWIMDDAIAYLAAFLVTFSYYTLELTSGRISLEHNDLAFLFYVTCSIWAFTRYLHSHNKFIWAILIGTFAGLAILNKWLVGLLIFGGWGLYILLSENRIRLQAYVHLLVSGLIACLVFLPWQVYILHSFPAESAIAFEYNRRHMTEDLGHPGDHFFHFSFLRIAYHEILVGLLILGGIGIFFNKKVNRNMSIAFIAMIVVVFLFFSFFVATKMPAFVYCVSSLLFILMAYGMFMLNSTITKPGSWMNQHKPLLWSIMTLLIGFICLKPFTIMEARGKSNVSREIKINNSTVYSTLDEATISDHVVLNCRSYENIELMFYKNCTAYHWYPPERTLDSLQAQGYKFAAFQYINDPQQLPDYITNDKEIVILPAALK